MRGDRGARDSRHNKDFDNLKSSLKKGTKGGKKHRVVFDETANEFFEADYIIVVRDECAYSDEGESEECSGCGSCERYQEPEPTGALSPPDGYKDLSLFNRDGTLREQAWWEAGDVVLVGERSGTVFTTQHLQLLRRLQRERLLRAAICADCDAHAALHQPLELEYEEFEEVVSSTGERELRPVARRTAKHIAAGEERPRTNSSQQTTPTDESPPDISIEETRSPIHPVSVTSEEESDAGDTDGRLSLESSPLRQRRAGILKGGRLWKSLDTDKDIIEQQNEDQRSITTASDEDGSVTPRSVRFLERPKDSTEEEPKTTSDTQEAETNAQKDYAAGTLKLETPLILTAQPPKSNSAVQQLFNSGRPPPPAIEPQLVTSESLRVWDAGARPKPEEPSVRRVAERNALRCSLLRSEARKKQQPRQETTSLAERIRLLTCDVEDDPDDQRSAPAAANVDKFPATEKNYGSDKGSEKAFGSASSSSSSSTISAPVNSRHHADLDHHQEPQKPRAERRQFLSTLAPLTACVGSAAHHEGFYYVPPTERTASTEPEHDSPAPDVVAGTPGAARPHVEAAPPGKPVGNNKCAADTDDGLAAFARAAAPRTERLRQRYGPESQSVSSDDEHDDYGFQRRPAVRGIAVKQQLGASNQMLQQMQSELQPSPSTAAPAHACQRTNSTYAWPYYSEANLNSSRPQSRTSASSNWSKSSDYVSGRQSAQPHECYAHAHAQNASSYAHYQQRQDPNMYRNCSLYANVGCADSNQELYSSQTSSEQTSPVRARCRRPESPPPIRSQHHLLYLPYNSHNHSHETYSQQWTANDYARMQNYYQQASAAVAAQVAQMRGGAGTPQPAAGQPQRAHYAHALQQTLCAAPVRYRPVPASQPGGGKQMICYSERVAPPLYQPAPGSPSRASRGAPEGAAGAATGPATSPIAPQANPVFYAMNV